MVERRSAGSMGGSVDEGGTCFGGVDICIIEAEAGIFYRKILPHRRTISGSSSRSPMSFPVSSSMRQAFSSTAIRPGYGLREWALIPAICVFMTPQSPDTITRSALHRDHLQVGEETNHVCVPAGLPRFPISRQTTAARLPKRVTR